MTYLSISGIVILRLSKNAVSHNYINYGLNMHMLGIDYESTFY